MDNKITLNLQSHNYSKKSMKKENFKSIYGIWTVNNVLCSKKFFATIALDPINEGINIRDANISIRYQIHGNSYTVSPIFVEKFVFSFVFHCQNDGYSTIETSFTIEIEMPKNAEATNLYGVKSHLKKLFESKNFSDVTIKVVDKEIKVHKSILSRSDVFNKMLEKNNTNESRSGIINIGDIEYEVIVEMCRFLYYDELMKIDTLALKLLVAADKYLIDDLAAKCESYLIPNVDTTNFIDVILTADILKKEKLQDAAIDYIINNRKTILPSDAWKKFKTEHMPLAMLVMEKFMLSQN